MNFNTRNPGHTNKLRAIIDELVDIYNSDQPKEKLYAIIFKISELDPGLIGYPSPSRFKSTGEVYGLSINEIRALAGLPPINDKIAG